MANCTFQAQEILHLSYWMLCICVGRSSKPPHAKLWHSKQWTGSLISHASCCFKVGCPKALYAPACTFTFLTSLPNQSSDQSRDQTSVPALRPTIAETDQQPISLLRSAQVMPSLLLNSLKSCKILLLLDGLIPICSLLSAVHYLLHVHTVCICLARPPLVPAVVSHNCSQYVKFATPFFVNALISDANLW